MTFCLANLMITGAATPYLHNGIMAADQVGGQWGKDATGILERNDVGFLVWTNTREETEDLGLGSRLKTPVTPVWVTCVNGQWGVLFNPNRDLMKSYSAENRSGTLRLVKLSILGFNCTTTATPETLRWSIRSVRPF